jgi:hypothetical protein
MQHAWKDDERNLLEEKASAMGRELYEQARKAQTGEMWVCQAGSGTQKLQHL